MRRKLLLFNVQDFFVKLAYPVTPADVARLSDDEWRLLAPADVPMKALHKLYGIARVFEAENPDFALLCEVGELESLANFSRLFLGDRYQAFATPPVSDRGIETGYLVRRDLGLEVEIRSHADEPVTFLYPHEIDPTGLEVTAMIASALGVEPTHQRRFSRDVPELRLTVPGRAEPSLILLMAHLKSGFDPHGIDKRGSARRAGEARALIKLYNDVSKAARGRVPVIVAGDLNGRAARPDTAPEFLSLYVDSDLVDALELAGHPRHDRVTQITYFLDKGEAGQLDYVLIPGALHARVVKEGTYVHRFKFAEGDGVIAFPGSMRDRHQLPSDHYPVIVTLDLDF